MAGRRLRGGCLMVALAAAGGPAAALAGDAGQTVFEHNCRACHSVMRGQNHVGPSLFEVIGRPAGSISSFVSSGALRGAPLVWSEATLEAFLADPQAAVPGTAMRFPGLKDAAERAAVIDYLKGR